MPASYNIDFGGERLVLNADRTLYWPTQKTLFATDLHAGKTAHMRRYGLAIPGGSLETDLQLLNDAATRHHATKLIFLGDLFHSEINAEWDVFAKWCQQQSFTIELVRGNHDRFLSNELLQAAHVTSHAEPYQLGPFSLRHHPADQLLENEYILAGHLHPAYWFHGPAKDQLRAPCFWLQPQQLILPAFGSFTGGLVVHPAANDHIYACALDRSAIIQN